MSKYPGEGTCSIMKQLYTLTLDEMVTGINRNAGRKVNSLGSVYWEPVRDQYQKVQKYQIKRIDSPRDTSLTMAMDEREIQIAAYCMMVGTQLV